MIINPYVFDSGPPPATYSYWNPADKAPDAILSDADRVVTGSGSGPCFVRSITSKSSGKWRVQLVDEIHPGTAGSMGLGFATAGSLGTYLGGTAAGFALWGNYPNLILYNNNAGNPFSGTLVSADVIDVLLDIDAGKAWWQINGTPVSGNPAAGTGEMITFTPGASIFIAADPYVSGGVCRFRANPSEFTGSSVPGFTDGWPD